MSSYFNTDITLRVIFSQKVRFPLQSCQGKLLLLPWMEVSGNSENKQPQMYPSALAKTDLLLLIKEKKKWSLCVFSL